MAKFKEPLKSGLKEKNHAGDKDKLLKPMHSGRVGKCAAKQSKTSATPKNHTHRDNALSRTKTKQRFPAYLTLDHPNNPQRAAISNVGRELFPNYLSKHQSYQKVVVPPSPPKMRRLTPVEKRAKFLNDYNLKQKKLKAVKDVVQKRRFALQTDEEVNALAVEIFNEETIPYASTRIDNVLPSAKGPSTMNIEFGCGFYGYSPSFTAAKKFNVTVDKFSHPIQLNNMIVNDPDFARTAKEVGINIKHRSIAIVGYEFTYVKGYRYKATRNFLEESGVTYIEDNQKVLVNASSALREFFLQTREYVSDAFGNAQIPVIARFALLEPDTVFGGNKYVMFDFEWLTENEKDMLAEEIIMDVEIEKVLEDKMRDRLQAIKVAAEAAAQIMEDDMMDLGPDFQSNTAVHMLAGRCICNTELKGNCEKITKGVLELDLISVCLERDPGGTMSSSLRL